MAFNSNANTNIGDWYQPSIYTTTLPDSYYVPSSTTLPSSGYISSSPYMTQGVDLSGLYDGDTRREMSPSKDVGNVLAEMINKL
jgi:hypothetical protein